MKVRMTKPPEGIILSPEEKWKYANFTNSFIFGKALTVNTELVKEIIRFSVPDLQIADISIADRERRQEPSALSKASILDIRAELTDGKIIMIEMQVLKRDDFILRLRSYRSQYDTESLKPGHRFGELHEVIQIAICCFDPVGDDAYIYDYQMTDRYSGNILYQNKQRMILLNAAGHQGRISKDLKEFLTYVSGGEAEGAFVEKLDETVRQLKYDELARGEFMRLEDWADDRSYEAKLEGIREGKLEERKISVRTLFKTCLDLGLGETEAIGRIAETYQLSAEEIKSILREQ